MRIEISDLTFKCIIGILEIERIKKQKIIINLSFEYVFSKDRFINYAEVSALVEKTMKKKKFLLLEDAILYLENILNTTYEIKNLNIKISKPTILKNCIVSVSK